jgi:NADPH:quinone reductase-like Zn-dependent oxidoreductase
MKAALLHSYGDPEQLRYEETAMPKYGNDEVLVKMRATSVNPIDVKIRSGAAKSRMPIEFPAILGRDLSGEVVEIGGNGTGEWHLRGIHGPQGWRAAPIPDALSFEQAGALPLVTTTGTQLTERAVKPKAGQTVLVARALGGVGRTAVHVAHKHGARVLAGVRAKEKEEAAKLEVDGVVAIDSEEEIGHLHDLDAIADTVGGTTIQRLLKTIRKGGVLGSVLGEPEGAKKYDIRVEAFMSQPDASRLYQLAEEVARHEFSIPIARTMKLQEIQEAHRIFERGGLAGKIVLAPWLAAEKSLQMAL